MKYFILALLFSLPAEAIGPITAKNSAQIADGFNKSKHKNVYDQIGGEAKMGGYYTVFSGPCADMAFLKSDGYHLLDQISAMSLRKSCSVSW